MRASKRSKSSKAPKDWDDSLGENEWDDQPVASASRGSVEEWDVISRGNYAHLAYARNIFARGKPQQRSLHSHQRAISLPSYVYMQVYKHVSECLGTCRHIHIHIAICVSYQAKDHPASTSKLT